MEGSGAGGGDGVARAAGPAPACTPGAALGLAAPPAHPSPRAAACRMDAKDDTSTGWPGGSERGGAGRGVAPRPRPRRHWPGWPGLAHPERGGWGCRVGRIVRPCPLSVRLRVAGRGAGPPRRVPGARTGRLFRRVQGPTPAASAPLHSFKQNARSFASFLSARRGRARPRPCTSNVLPCRTSTASPIPTIRATAPPSRSNLSRWPRLPSPPSTRPPSTASAPARSSWIWPPPSRSWWRTRWMRGRRPSR